MAEKNLVTKIRQWAKSQGLWYAKMHGSIYSKRGMPDVLLIVEGHAWMIEVKRPGGKPRPWQARVIAELDAAGASTLIADSMEDVTTFYTYVIVPKLQTRK